MHGIVFLELKKYVESKLGQEAWSSLLEKADLKDKTFLPTKEYPDEEIIFLVSTASEITNQDIQPILEDFGLFLSPDLIKLAQSYLAMIDPKWKTIDFLAHTEETIHKLVRIKNPGAKPPELVTKKIDKNQIVIQYSSGRKMCSLAKGIITGVSRHYSENVKITEDNCMLNNDPECVIRVEVLKKKKRFFII